jgi:hypothetical protein
MSVTTDRSKDVEGRTSNKQYVPTQQTTMGVWLALAVWGGSLQGRQLAREAGRRGYACTHHHAIPFVDVAMCLPG